MLFFSCPSPITETEYVPYPVTETVTPKIYIVTNQSNTYDVLNNPYSSLSDAIEYILENSEVLTEYSILFSGTVKESIVIDYTGSTFLRISIIGLESNATIDAQSLSSVLTLKGSNLEVVLGEKLIVTNGLAGEGGGIHVLDSTLTIDGATIANNTAYFAGGGVYVKNGTFNMHSGTISNNIASGREKSSESNSDDSFIGHGGGVYVTGSFINNNTGTSDSPYWELVPIEATINHTDGIICENTATGPYGAGSGGGVYIHHNVSITNIHESKIYNNSANFDKDICSFIIPNEANESQ